MTTIMSVVCVGLSVALIFLVLMHSGKDAGLSGAFGVGTGQGSLGGGSLVERNLNRWTVGFAIAFAVNTIILLKSPFWYVGSPARIRSRRCRPLGCRSGARAR